MSAASRLARARPARLTGAALLALALVVGTGSTSSARPSQADLQAAKAKLDAMNHNLDVLVERYDQTQIKVQAIQHDLVGARKDAATAMSERDAAQRVLSARAVATYENSGSALEALLGSTSLADFSDRLEMVNRLAQQDADLAARAETKRQEAIRAQQRLNTDIARQRALLREIQTNTAQIKTGIDHVHWASARPRESMSTVT